MTLAEPIGSHELCHCMLGMVLAQAINRRIPMDPQREHTAEWLVAGYVPHPAGRAAVTTAALLAVRLGARLLVVHVVDLGDYPSDPDAADWEEHARTAVAQEHKQVEALLASVDVPWEFLTEHGDPAGRLLALAHERHALMIVVGMARPGLAAHLLEASVARRITRCTDRPVLLVPAGPGR
jgi:nucleotide-binding universal stress UspA family protein